MQDEEKQRHYATAEKLLAEQNMTAAVIGGSVAAVLAGVGYAIAASVLPSGYGFGMAGAGVVVGFTIGFLGRGISSKFAVLAAALTILAVLVGNAVRVVLSSASASRSSLPEAVSTQSMTDVLVQSMAYLSPLDLVYLLVAVFAAAFLGRRSLSRADRLSLGLYAERDAR